MSEHALLLLIALVIDWFVGDPDWLWRKLPHPVVAFGTAVELLDELLNGHRSGDTESNSQKVQRMGGVAIALLIFGAILVALILQWLIGNFGFVGQVLEVIIIWLLIAQKSLADHVGAVALALKEKGLEAGRGKVALIVGRDPQELDESGVARAAIESLAENFSDGVVAPAFWYLVFGLPGLLAYKMINTADSMIGYKNEKYLDFGRAAAQIDDLANWLPARLSALLIAAAAALKLGFQRGAAAFNTALRDAGLHASPNAGWPEAAMASACNIALGGPRNYGGKTVSQAYINGAGKLELGPDDIDTAMGVFTVACYVFWGAVLVFLLI